MSAQDRVAEPFDRHRKMMEVASRVVKKGSVVSIVRVLTKQGGDDEKPGAYHPRYVDDFFGGSNAVAVKLSKCATASLFSPPC